MIGGGAYSREKHGHFLWHDRDQRREMDWLGDGSWTYGVEGVDDMVNGTCVPSADESSRGCYCTEDTEELCCPTTVCMDKDTLDAEGRPTVAQCRMLGSSYATFIQGLCAVLGFASLVLKKRWVDSGKEDRGWKVWGMDVAKQATSGLAAHGMGMLNASILTTECGPGNECSWYLISFTFDTTFGVVFGYCLLHTMQAVAKRGLGSLRCPSLEETGNYWVEGTGEKVLKESIWLKQLLAWCLITLVARMMTLGLLVLNQGWLGHWSTAVAAAFDCEPDVLLTLVMLGCPFGMNALQLWIQDQFLKQSDREGSPFSRWLRRCRGLPPIDLTAPLVAAPGAEPGAFSTELPPTFSVGNIETRLSDEFSSALTDSDQRLSGSQVPSR